MAFALLAGTLMSVGFGRAAAPGEDKPPLFPKRHTQAVNGLALSPDGRLLASGSWDRTIRLWDASRGEELRCLRGHGSCVFRLAFSPDGGRLASAGYDGTVLLWDPATGKELQRLAAQSKMLFGVAFSPDGRVVAASGDSGVIDRWDPASGKALTTFRLSVSQISALAFSPDSRLLAAACYDGTARLLDAATGKELRRLAGHTDNWIHYVSFSPDGRMLASSSEDRTIRLWEAATGKERLLLTGHEGLVGSVIFTADGRSLVSTSYDKTIRFWETVSGKERFRLRDEHGWPRAVVLAPGRRALFSSSDAGTLSAWDITNRLPDGPPSLEKLSDREKAALWEHLADPNARRAYRLICSLAGSPSELLALLRKRLPPAPTVSKSRIARLIAQLDDDDFFVREKASRGLRELGGEIEPLLHQALDEDPSQEVRRRIRMLLSRGGPRALTPEQLREVRAVEALEMAATPEARRLLRALAGGAESARLTREARASLDRLSRREHQGLPRADR
jgi:hypothetical protein